MRSLTRHPFAILFVFYTLASLAHFTHNAEYIAFYPGLPAAMTRGSVYGAWCVVAAVGLLAVAARQTGHPRTAALLLVVYGLLGVDGLLHYTLALCSEHTLATNITIWTEVVLGLILACAAVVKLKRLGAQSCVMSAREWPAPAAPQAVPQRRPPPASGGGSR